MILTTGRVIGKINEENNTMNYMCLMFRFATQTFNGGYKSKITVLLVVLACEKLSPPQLEALPSLNDSLPG